ncbi:hypothetical protein SHIRM173S_09847 [Streptomyces hirsutus]
MTVPPTRFVILMLMLLQIIATMQVFTEPFVITGGGPESSTVTVLYLIYKYAFLYNDFGGACALSVMLLALLGLFSARLPPAHPFLRGGGMSSTRTLVSPAVLARPRGRAIYWTVFTGVVLLFALAFLFPVYWMVTGAMKSPDEVARTPPDLLPDRWSTSGWTDAWELMQLPTHLWNTVVQAAGAWLFQLVFCTAAAYALSRLRPAFGTVVLGGILATLMVPAQALVVPSTSSSPTCR